MNIFARISGIGLLTPLGRSVPATWGALCEGRFIRDHAQAEGSDGSPDRILGMAESVAREAMAQAQWDQSGDQSGDESTALVIGTSKGPVQTWLPPAGANLIYGDQYNWEGRSRGDGSGVLGLAAISSILAHKLRIRGPRLTLCAACASGLHALIRGVLMTQSGEVQRVLVVAAEASVHPLFLGSFGRLGVLPPVGVGCRPFDRHRGGFLMSEAAAAVCLEASNSPTCPSSDLRVRVDRFGLAGDGTHLTGSDPQARVLRRLLDQVMDHQPVDLIHAHATGTPLNDATELAAIEAVAGEVIQKPPSLYSHKGALGHSLGAAGLVAIVLNCMAHQSSLIPPNVQTHHPLPTRHVRLEQSTTRRDVSRSLAIAAGFGGPMAAVSLVSTGKRMG